MSHEEINCVQAGAILCVCACAMYHALFAIHRSRSNKFNGVAVFHHIYFEFELNFLDRQRIVQIFGVCVYVFFHLPIQINETPYILQSNFMSMRFSFVLELICTYLKFCSLWLLGVVFDKLGIRT